jgi:hypothetical protein
MGLRPNSAAARAWAVGGVVVGLGLCECACTCVEGATRGGGRQSVQRAVSGLQGLCTSDM